MIFEERFKELLKQEKIDSEKFINSSRNILNWWGLVPYKHKQSTGDIHRLRFFFMSGALEAAKDSIKSYKNKEGSP